MCSNYLNHPVFKLALGLSLLFAITTQGLAAPDPAAELRRQQEREQNIQQQNTTTPDIRLNAQIETAEAMLPEQETPCFQIDSISLQAIDAEGTPQENHPFKWAKQAANFTETQKLDNAEGRCLGSKSINIVMKRIQNAIVAKGYVTTRILAMPQNLNSKTLTLTVIPGRVRDIKFKNAPSRGRHSNTTINISWCKTRRQWSWNPLATTLSI